MIYVPSRGWTRQAGIDSRFVASPINIHVQLLHLTSLRFPNNAKLPLAFNHRLMTTLLLCFAVLQEKERALPSNRPRNPSQRADQVGRGKQRLLAGKCRKGLHTCTCTFSSSAARPLPNTTSTSKTMSLSR